MKTLGQIAYEAHKEERYRAKWEDLPEHEKEQWKRAAEAVAKQVRFENERPGPPIVFYKHDGSIALPGVQE